MQDALEAIRRAAPRRVVVFTGAGVSADSGIPTFRGAGGLWRDFRAEDLATPEAFARNPQLVLEWYEWRRGLVRAAEPNAAHRAIARLEDAIVVTQNVDGLHERAGSRHIIELHGNIFRMKCSTPHPPLRGTFSPQAGRRALDVESPSSLDVQSPSPREAGRGWREAPGEGLPRCDCGAFLRPDVVWFGEMLPREALVAAVNAIRQSDLLLIIGTSGIVYPAAGLVAGYAGLSIEINPQPSITCTFSIAARAAEATPPVVEAILEARRD